MTDFDQAPSTGAAILYTDGYRMIDDVPVFPEHYDAQGHLNNAAIGQLFNDMRIFYIRSAVGAWWVEVLQSREYVVAAREAHILYESEGLPGEEFVGAMRYLRFEGKAAVLEQRLVESNTGRAVARAWVVQLLLQRGAVVDWPSEYLGRVDEFEARGVGVVPKSSRSWGPGESMHSAE